MRCSFIKNVKERKKNAAFFYKEKKRTQRMQRSFYKKNECPTLVYGWNY